MARKHEDWSHLEFNAHALAEVFTDSYSDREVPIVACSILDALLADLIRTQLRDDKREATAFLGLSGDGRAPLGAFGSRIQAAFLLNLIDTFELSVLRILKDIRNDFSHKVKVKYSDVLMRPKFERLTKLFSEHGPSLRKPERECTTREEYETFVKESNFSGEACAGYYIGAASIMVQHLQDKLKEKVNT